MQYLTENMYTKRLFKLMYRFCLKKYMILFILVQDYADIKYSMSTLKIGNLKKLDNPSNPNEISSTEVIWTKETGWSTAETKWDAQYKLQETPPDLTDHYVQTFVYGIVSAMTTLQYTSGTGDR